MAPSSDHDVTSPMTDKPDAEAARLAAMIDHTLLKPEATWAEVRHVCDEAIEWGFAGVCVNGTNLRAVAERLRGHDVKAVAVVGFPLGAATARTKAFETRELIRLGADEIDMVINVGALKSGAMQAVLKDIRGVVVAARERPVKVILETVKLTRDEKLMACTLAKAAGAAFVKTSTGFGGGGATVEDVALMRSVVGDEIGVKASGGIRDRATALTMIEAGATRIGASSSLAIISAAPTGSSAY